MIQEVPPEEQELNKELSEQDMTLLLEGDARDLRAGSQNYGSSVPCTNKADCTCPTCTKMRLNNPEAFAARVEPSQPLPVEGLESTAGEQEPQPMDVDTAPVQFDLTVEDEQLQNLKDNMLLMQPPKTGKPPNGKGWESSRPNTTNRPQRNDGNVVRDPYDAGKPMHPPGTRMVDEDNHTMFDLKVHSLLEHHEALAHVVADAGMLIKDHPLLKGRDGKPVKLTGPTEDHPDFRTHTRKWRHRLIFAISALQKANDQDWILENSHMETLSLQALRELYMNTFRESTISQSVIAHALDKAIALLSSENPVR